MMIINRAIFILAVFPAFVYLWDPDAGLVTSWTKMTGVTVGTTSTNATAMKVIDGDDNTNWVSGFCLPSGYVNREDVNILRSSCQNNACTFSRNTHNDIAGATDGSVYTTTNIQVSNNQGIQKAEFSIHLQQATDIRILSLWGMYHDSTVLSAIGSDGYIHSLKTLSTTDSYKEIRIDNVLRNITQIKIESPSDFGIKEIAAIGISGCKEQIVVDLGTVRNVGAIRTRHWAGTNAALNLKLKTSTNGNVWEDVSSLDPNALHSVVTHITSQHVRYIALQYDVVLKDYMKVYCWEVDAWDQNQQWGPPQNAQIQTNTIRQMLGVNGIWGWGHNKYSNSLNKGEGPELYDGVASHARNYHNLDWDVTDPDNDPEFTRMGMGLGTQAKSWLNWDQEYRAWSNANLTVDASVQFTRKSFSESMWNFPQTSAFNYGQKFAAHFGSAVGNGLVKAMEVGNEPWDYEANFYAMILEAMSAGVRSVDKVIDVLPGAFQAHDKFDTGSYIGTRVKQQFSTNISVVNFHTYSFRTNDVGVRIGTYPEDKDSSFNSIRNIIRWRNTNMPRTPIWVTEWGWDASGGGESCTFPECVTEEAQALYGIRGLLILSRYSFEKVTWFFYANSPSCSTLFCRSGLTTSKNQGFAKKAIFHAFFSLLDIIGDKYFMHVLQEDPNGYVYGFGDNHANGMKVTHIIAWKPVDISDSSASPLSVRIPSGQYPRGVWRFTGSTPALEKCAHCINGQNLTLDVSAHPVVVELSNIDIGNVIGR